MHALLMTRYENQGRTNKQIAKTPLFTDEINLRIAVRRQTDTTPVTSRGSRDTQVLSQNFALHLVFFAYFPGVYVPDD